jgi:hypothetical protein
MVSFPILRGEVMKTNPSFHKSKIVDDDPMSWLGFEEDCIITACAHGHVRRWDRPQEGVNSSQIDLSGTTHHL